MYNRRMVLSDRQKDILQKAVFEYIERAQPISSSWLEAKYDMLLSTATIRNELAYLSEHGYLEQPHTSAGRVPTDRGYRFFVDQVMAQGLPAGGEEVAGRQELEQKIRDHMEFVRATSRSLAKASLSLTVVYFPERSLLWKEGWEEVLRAPEFETRESIENFMKFLVDVEKGIRKFHSEKLVEIYIGEENPFSREKDFSILISAYSFPRKQTGIMALMGPKRMAYQKNIGLLNSLRHLFGTRQTDGKRT